MALQHYPNRLMLAAILSSLLVLGLCGTVAVLLPREQSRTADVLEENIGSRQAAARLIDTLADLIVAHHEGTNDVRVQQQEAERHLAEIGEFANTPREQVLFQRIADSYQRYLALWKKMEQQSGPKLDLIREIQEETLPACKELHDFNLARIDESQRKHRAALRRMTWGLAVVGGLGSVAGLVLGYGLARGLRRTIQQFMIRIQGAADLLGPELTKIEWQRSGATLRDASDELVTQIEQAVVRLQQREREVRRAERLAAMGQLAAGFAHKIRNPLASVLLLFQTARKDPSSGGLNEVDLDLIEQELQRIERSLQSFLDYARPPRLARSVCDLVEVVRDSLAISRGRIDQQGTTVDFDAPSGGCELDADWEQLRQMVLNLILNALDAMPSGGRLSLTVRAIPAGTVELTVTDTGAGISPQVLPRMFEPFATDKETGLGLGLVVSKRIVEEHGGTIHGANRSAGGASFVVRLPLRQTEVGRSQILSASASKDSSAVVVDV